MRNLFHNFEKIVEDNVLYCIVPFPVTEDRRKLFWRHLVTMN